MNNSDFSRLLTTNDKELVTALTSRTGGTTAAKAKRKERAARFSGGAKGKGKGKDGDDSDGGGPNKKARKGGGKGETSAAQKEYRDRAKDRRELTGEYAHIAAEFENQQDLEADQSKYLGGDLDHTHLVKGLDFALLSKVRTELTKQDKRDELQKAKTAKKQGLHKKRTFESELARKVWHSLVETLHPHHSTFKQRMQNMGKAIAAGQKIRGAPSVFLPGRMSYEFDPPEEAGAAYTDIPRIIYTSKEDAPRVNTSTNVASVVPETVLRLKETLQRAAEDRRQRRQEKKGGTGEVHAVAQKVPLARHKARDIDNDIFGDAGEYNPAEFLPKEAKEKGDKVKATAAETKKQKSYFDDAGAEKYRRGTDEQLEAGDIEVEEDRAVLVELGETGGPVVGDDSAYPYQPASRFDGRKRGWVFKLGSQGLGYYKDMVALAALAQKAKKEGTPASDKDGRKPLRQPKEQPAGRRPPVVDDDAYGDCFPDSNLGMAMVRTGKEEESDDEDPKKKKLKEKLQGKSGKDGKEDSVTSSAYGKKGGAEAGKKKKMNDTQEWNKIDNMIRKGKVQGVEGLEAFASKHNRRDGPSQRDIFATPANIR